VAATLANQACTHTRRSTPCAARGDGGHRGRTEMARTMQGPLEARPGAFDAPRQREPRGGGAARGWSPEDGGGEDLRRTEAGTR
jgi:hypothetical protein